MKEYRGDILFRKLRERIAQMPHGAPFPSVRQLMEEYSVSQFTVTPALARLRELGLLESFVGRGAFVRKNGEDARFNILLLVNLSPSAGIANMVKMLQLKAEEFNFNLEITYFTHQENVFARLNTHRADAIIVEAPPNDLNLEQIRQLSQATIPVVVSHRAVRVEHLCYVTGNDDAIGIMAANTLYQAGHRQVGVIYSEPHIFTTTRRVESFRLCAQTNGCDVHIYDCETRIGQNSAERSAAFIRSNHRRILDEVSALFFIGAESACSAYEVFRKLQIPVPDRISLLGTAQMPDFYDNIITTVKTSAQLMAQHVMEILRDRLERRFLLPPQVEIDPVCTPRQTLKQIVPKERNIVV